MDENYQVQAHCINAPVHKQVILSNIGKKSLKKIVEIDEKFNCLLDIHFVDYINYINDVE